MVRNKSLSVPFSVGKSIGVHNRICDYVYMLIITIYMLIISIYMLKEYILKDKKIFLCLYILI
jgi:hypothetical protein